MSKVSERVNSLAATIKAGIVFDEAGTSKLANTVFEESLPEGITIDTVKKVQESVLDFTDAATKALGEAGLDFLKEKTDIGSVSLTGKLGNDVMNVEIERKRTFRNPSTGEPGVKYGGVSASLKTGVGSGRGGFKEITGQINEAWAGAFNS